MGLGSIRAADLVSRLAGDPGSGAVLSKLILSMNEIPSVPAGTRTSVLLEVFGADEQESRRRLRLLSYALKDRWYCDMRSTASVWGCDYEVVPATAAVYAAFGCARREVPAGRPPVGGGDRMHDFAHGHLEDEFTNYTLEMLDTAHACVNLLLFSQASQSRSLAELLDMDPHAERHWWADRFREWPYLHNYRPAARPEGEMRLYRNAPGGREDGAVWTQSYAHATLGRDSVWEATFPAAAILAAFPHRPTLEGGPRPGQDLAQYYVVDPAIVDGTQIVEAWP